MKWYFKQNLIAIDQVVNTIFGGWADETISSRSYRWHKNGITSIPFVIINTIFLNVNHCEWAYNTERNRLQSPPETRTPLTDYCGEK